MGADTPRLPFQATRTALAAELAGETVSRYLSTDQLGRNQPWFDKVRRLKDLIAKLEIASCAPGAGRGTPTEAEGAAIALTPPAKSARSPVETAETIRPSVTPEEPHPYLEDVTCPQPAPLNRTCVSTRLRPRGMFYLASSGAKSSLVGQSLSTAESSRP